METFDFSTLYTNLPHEEIKKKFSKIFNKVYVREAKTYINVNNFGANFSAVKNKNKFSLRFEDMMDILSFILDNIYVKFGNDILKQVIGIPIGLDSGQDIANLLLFSYESDYVDLMSKQNIVFARNFNFCFRYIDDLFVGNFPNFKNFIHSIYPRELEINSASNNVKNVAYLDLNITSDNNSLKFSVYDKREDFNFDIVNFPFIDSCIPKNSALGVFFSQLIRFARICTFFPDFQLKAKNLSKKLQNQGYLFRDLKKLTLRFFKERHDLVINYRITDANSFARETLFTL